VPIRAPDFADLPSPTERRQVSSAPTFPTEIGWAIIREDGSVESGSCLIRPPAKWTMYGNAWPASKRLTGITGEMLDGEALTSSNSLCRHLWSVAR
jgi:hypothetical protein